MCIMHTLHFFVTGQICLKKSVRPNLNSTEEKDRAHKFIYETKLFHHVQSTAKTVNVELSKRKQHFCSL